MTPERWKQIDELLSATLALTIEKRTVFLDEACAGDDELRKEVENLLSADHHAGSSIEGSPKLLAADLIRTATVQFRPALSGSLLGDCQ